MNKVFDYNGTFVSASRPVKQLRSVKKTFMIDSADRDLVKYFTNGDFVVYLPRVYENVVSIRLMAAEFPLLFSEGQGGALTHSYSNGQNILSTAWNSDSQILSTDNVFYFLIDIEGLNKTDECAVAGNRSSFPDGYFAKIPATQTNSGGFIEYNDHSAQDNISRYTPPIGKLDRMHIRTRLHNQQGNQGFIYWTSDGNIPYTSQPNSPQPDEDNYKKINFSLSFEIEYLDNVFDDFSSLESRISERGV
jgi:hypothetical protein